MGCATAKKEFDPNVKEPQMIVEPETIRLGVAKVMGTQFVLRGRGFQPEDSVFIKISGVKTKDKVVDIPIFDGDVDKDGHFTITTKPGYDPSGLTFKIGVLLRAKTGTNKKGETMIVVTQPPIPEGVYTLKAVSMESDKTAECKLTIKGPSILDRMKDWMGGLMGKIEKK
ncbi:MAG: hypothetical protein KKB35_00495, partial [Proteobacteria bacterium]|nr:hypothetical protein [Pseudomonadota bacterium]